MSSINHIRDLYKQIKYSETKGTLLSEASFDIGPGHKDVQKKQKLYNKGAKTDNPHEKEQFLKRTGPQLPLAKSKPGMQVAGFEMNGEFLGEKEMTAKEKSKEDRLKDKYDDSEMKQNMIDQYGKERGTQIYFAKIRKMAMEECECDTEENESNKEEKEKIDPREMKTRINLVKNKLRSMGLKMGYEPEGEQLDELAPLAAGALAAGAAGLGAMAIQRARQAAKSGVNAAKSGAKVKPSTGIAGAAYGMQKRNQALGDAMKQLRQDFDYDDAYDYIIEMLVAADYAEDYEAAEVMFEHMSDEFTSVILEEYIE